MNSDIAIIHGRIVGGITRLTDKNGDAYARFSVLNSQTGQKIPMFAYGKAAGCLIRKVDPDMEYQWMCAPNYRTYEGNPHATVFFKVILWTKVYEPQRFTDG